MSNRALKLQSSGPRIGRRRAASLAAVASGSSAVEPAPDPVLAALDEMKALRAREAAALDVFRGIEAACKQDLGPIWPCTVTFNGIEFRTLEHFDNECRHGRLSFFADQPRIAELRAELGRYVAAREIVEHRHGYWPAQDAYELAGDLRFEVEERALDMEPASRSGALGLLRLVSDLIERRNGSYCDPEEDAEFCRAIARSLAVLERLDAKEWPI